MGWLLRERHCHLPDVVGVNVIAMAGWLSLM